MATGGVLGWACWVVAAQIAAGVGTTGSVEEEHSSKVHRWELREPTVWLSSVICASRVWLSALEIDDDAPKGAGPAAGRVGRGVDCLAVDFRRGMFMVGQR